MPSRRTLRVLLVVAIILIAAGIFSVAYGSSPSYVGETDPIPAGWENFNEFSWSVMAGGSLTGNFSALNGTPVNVLVLNDADYNSFVNGANLSGLYNRTAVTGTLSLNVPGFNTYHVIFQHGAGYENSTQYVYVNLTATGLDPTFTLGGVVAIIFGAVLIVYSFRKSRRPAGTTGTLPSRATIGPPPVPPAGPDGSTSGSGTYRIPPPLPGDVAGPPAASYPKGTSPAPSTDQVGNPVGTLLVTVQNASATDATLDLVVNGVAVASMTVPAGQSAQTSVNARLTSPFGSTVTVEAVMAGGRRARQAVFVGAGGSAPITLRVG